MSDSTSLLMAFGDGRYRFFLPLKAQVEVERLTGKALGLIYDELCASIGQERDTEVHVYLPGPARAKDAYEIIRLAAQYGALAEVAGQQIKTSAIDATRLADQYVDGRPYTEFMPVAWAILQATLTGIKLETPKKKGRARRTKPLSEAKS